MPVVTNIERFATHDGPGIRTTVFLKGCPLRCPWCANPEARATLPVVMRQEERCVGCGACVRACPAGALSLGTAGVATTWGFDPHACAAWQRGHGTCRACERACLQEALSIPERTMSVEDIVAVCLRDRDYYGDDGGVTLSGGEPLFKREQAVALARALHEAGLQVAVETTASVPAENVAAVEPYVDIFQVDFKAADDELLRRVTGGNPALVKANLRWLLDHHPRELVVARMPVIPGFNDAPEQIRAAIDWLAGQGVFRIDLLPYHTLGKGKFARMGLEYECSDRMMDPQELEPYRAYAESLGVNGRVGG